MSTGDHDSKNKLSASSAEFMRKLSSVLTQAATTSSTNSSKSEENIKDGKFQHTDFFTNNFKFQVHYLLPHVVPTQSNYFSLIKIFGNTFSSSI